MNIKELLKPQGYVVWIDREHKWHSSEVDIPQLAVSHVTWLLGVKQPWQKEPANFALEAWIIPIRARHQALKIAKDDYKRKLLVASQPPTQENQ